MIEQPTLSRRFGWQPFILWIALTLVGYYLAGGFHFPAGFGSSTYDPRAVGFGSGIVGFVFGAVSGLIIASLQWIVLRSWAPNARWIPFNVIGYGLIHALGDAVPYMPAVLVGGGIIIGLAQYLALRHSLTKPILWIPIAGIAWICSFQLGFVMPQRPEQYNLTLAALTYGVITGLALRLLLVEDLAVPMKADALTLVHRWSRLNPIKKVLVVFLSLAAIIAFVLLSGLRFGLG